MKDVPKLGGPDSLFFRAGLEGGYSSRLSSLSSSQQFPGQAGQTKKTGKWNAMHVRIAWEIHQQKAKNDSKPGPGGHPAASIAGGGVPPKHGFDLLNKSGGPPGADFLGKRPGPPQDLIRAHNPSSLYGGSLGLPAPPNPFDPLSARDPFGAQRFYGSSPLAPPGLAAAYPRYPAPGGSQPPFGGLGLPAMVPSSHSAPSGHTIAGQHARPGPLGPPPLSSVGSPMDPRYPGYRPQTTSQAAWPLKSESSLLNHKEKERREEEDKVRRERREAEERRMREESQRARESELRVSREGFPNYIKEKERNG